jgi:hypothetical protein
VTSLPLEPPWDAYAQAVVDIEMPDGIVTVGPAGLESTRKWWPPAGTSVHIITAYNPGERLPDAENQRAQSRLIAQVEALRSERPNILVWQAVGRNRENTWKEPSVAILGLTSDEARLLGREYGQDAIFEWATGWMILPCSAGEQRTYAGCPVVRNLVEDPTLQRADMYDCASRKDLA